ncbi:MAG TPA: class I SAM-dependent methyltransferase [Puia sp.]|nr:class I SAM-dependent methyltransferase [Puia sp.]
MQTITALQKTSQQPANYIHKMVECITTPKNKILSQWTVEQLHILPYQHILEIGFGLGNTIREVANKLQVGFIAGTDESVDMFQQASKKNKIHLQKELMQLHIGTANELPYPPQYFHSIYTTVNYAAWKEPEYKFMQLQKFLKTGGRLVTVFQPKFAKTEKELWNAAEKIQNEYHEAGLTDIRISFRDMSPVNAIAAVGFKE